MQSICENRVGWMDGSMDNLVKILVFQKATVSTVR